MNRLRIEQRKDEPADLFALRACMMAYGQIDDNTKLAMARWLWSYVNDDLKKRGLGVPFSNVAAAIYSRAAG